MIDPRDIHGCKEMLSRLVSSIRCPLAGRLGWGEGSTVTKWHPKSLLSSLVQPTSTVASTQTQTVTDSPPPREFYGAIRQVKSSPMKLNLVAKLIRGMSMANALAQVEFCEKKAATFVQMVLLETQRRAVKRHGVNPLNLWVAKSYVGKGTYLKRIRYHGKGMHGIMHKYYAHYFLVLQEGKPPKKKRDIENHKSRKTRKLILAGPRSIPNSL